MDSNKRYEAGINAMEELFSQDVRNGMEGIKKYLTRSMEHDRIIWLWRPLL